MPITLTPDAIRASQAHGLVIADRCLAQGRLADPGPEDLGDPGIRALEQFNPYLMIHPQLRAVMLPLGDGVALASKSRPLVRASKPAMVPARLSHAMLSRSIATRPARSLSRIPEDANPSSSSLASRRALHTGPSADDRPSSSRSPTPSMANSWERPKKSSPRAAMPVKFSARTASVNSRGAAVRRPSTDPRSQPHAGCPAAAGASHGASCADKVPVPPSSRAFARDTCQVLPRSRSLMATWSAWVHTTSRSTPRSHSAPRHAAAPAKFQTPRLNSGVSSPTWNVTPRRCPASVGTNGPSLAIVTALRTARSRASCTGSA